MRSTLMDHTDQFKLVLVTATDLIIKNHQLSMMLKPGMVQRISQTAADRVRLLHLRFHKYLQFLFGYLFKADHKFRTGEPVYISFSP